MPVYVKWIDEKKRIIHLQYVGIWTWSEHDKASLEISEMLNSVEHPVALISDPSQAISVPRSATMLRKGAEGVAFWRSHKNFADSIAYVVSDMDYWMHLGYWLFKKIYNYNSLFMVSSVEEACDALNRVLDHAQR